jgi:ABC-2 type transport system ATP-binding protein
MEDDMESTAVYDIQATGLSKLYGERKAVDGISLRIERGSLFSLLGPNGAGKTTTIGLLCGLLRPSAGSVSILGLDMERERSAIMRSVGISPQETAVAGRLSVRENLELMGGIYGMKRAEAKDRAAYLMGALGILDRSGDRVGTLSGGTQRKVSLGMALVPNPAVLFLDEPTVGLDPQGRKDLWALIAGLKGTTTIVLTTHYLEEADALADSVSVMRDGRIIASGTPAELKRNVFDMRVMTISSAAVSKGTMEALTAAYGDVRAVDGGLEIRSASIDFDAVVDLFRSRGERMEGASIKEPSLDDAYFKIIGKEAL